jgi:hypothetical protein
VAQSTITLFEKEDAMPTVIYAIGHSTRAIDDFIEVSGTRITYP